MLLLQLFNDTHKENCVLLNSAQELIEVEAWLRLTSLLCLHNQLSHIKDYRCLKNVIHQIDRNEWLLLSAFQQGLRQNLSWIFKNHNIN